MNIIIGISVIDIILFIDYNTYTKEAEAKGFMSYDLADPLFVSL